MRVPCELLINPALLVLFTFVSPENAENSKQAKSAEKPTPKTILDEPSCGEVKSICGQSSENDDLLVLECLLSTSPERLQNLPSLCQTTIWTHVRHILGDDNVKALLRPICAKELDSISCPPSSGSYLRCLLSNIRDVQDEMCYHRLLRLEGVAFSDHDLIASFLDQCLDDVVSHKCGRFDPTNFSQQKTVACLQDNILTVRDACKKEVFRLSEIQANSIKLDSLLYRDCNNDYSRYCPNIAPGSGRVISCLMMNFHTDPHRIDPKCRQHLMRRQKLIAQDYRVSKGLIRACKEDIRRAHCKKQASSEDKTVRLAQILLCLENSHKNGTRLEDECEKEIFDHRRMLLEDYRLSPELVNGCKDETSKYCQKFEYGGTTIHCLMKYAKEDRLSSVCVRALEDLVKETDAGENWEVDPVLHEACSPVVKVACRDLPAGNAKIMSCLMDNLRSDTMTEDCENALLEIQYFVARDFDLDPQLYDACKQDAAELCHHVDVAEGPKYGAEVLPCLYRYAYVSSKDLKLQKPCLQQVLRVMRQRALNVDLHPEIEGACLRDLADLCNDKVRRGEEMQCLQDNLDELDDECHKAVESFTELEAKHIELNPFVSKNCAKVIAALCDGTAASGEGSVMDCLVENKNGQLVRASPACRASIEHFQLISLKDIRFTYKFKVACKAHVMRLCKNRAGSKAEVIACLSEHILNATVEGLKSNIPKDCRQALKAQIFQQREKIDFDPNLKKACLQDVKKFCANVQPENSQVLECLQMVPNNNLSQKCGKEIFKIQKMEAYDNSVDYALQITCADAIDQFCSHNDKETVFNCLKLNKDEKGFSKKCRLIVMHRLIEQNTNNLLSPSLQQNCQMDIRKFCKKEVMASDEKQVGDSVMGCLKAQFKVSRLTNTCEREIAEILRERALDVNLNVNVLAACKTELETMCKFPGDESGKVEECLKVSYVNRNIATPKCKQEVANMIVENQADIHTDPMLQNACAWDLRTYCSHVEQGDGRHIKCLKKIMDSATQTLSASCISKLKERVDMFKIAGPPAAPENLQQLYSQVSVSPAKNFFVIVLLMMVGVTFFVGVFCGRFTRKKYSLLKNK